MSKPVKRLALLVVLVCLLLVAGGLWWFSQPPPHVAPSEARWGHTGGPSLTGDANLLRGGQTSSLGHDAKLLVGDAVISGNYDAELVHRAGPQCRLAPRSHLLLMAGPPEKLDAQLLFGAVRIETDKQSLGVRIGTPFGVVQTSPYQVTVADIGLEQVYVRVGEVVVLTEGESRNVARGFKAGASGDVQPIGPGDPLVLEDLIFSMQSHMQAAANTIELKPVWLELQPAVTTRYARPGVASRVPAKAQRLMLDDLVVTQVEGAPVKLEGWGQLEINPNTAMRITQASRDAKQASVALLLEAGGVDFHLTRQDRELQTLLFRLGHREVRVHAGYKEASGYVGREKNHLHITLQLGEIEIGSQHIEAGSSVTIDANGIEIRPLVAQSAPVRLGRATVVHTAKGSPAVAFTWPATSGNQKHLVEIARDEHFKDVRMAENLHGDHFIVSGVASGRTLYWRVDHGKVATLRALPPPRENCAHCLGIDPISDEVRRTEVRYDDVTPELAFTWRPRSDADYYLFRLWRANHFAKPVAIRHAKDPNTTLDGGIVEAGDYVWKVAMYDDEGRLLHTSELYDLSVRSSSSAPLNITAPPPVGQSDGESVLTHGLAHPKTALRCNGTNIPVDGDGYFEQAIPLRPGHNALYYSVSDDEADHVFMREVERTATP